MYCSEMTEHARSRVLAAFERRFGVRPNWLVRAPGRVNLLGAHVDYSLVNTSRPLDAVLSEFFFHRQATLNGPSAGGRP